MMIEDVRQLASWLGEAGLSTLELQQGDDRLLLRRAAPPRQAHPPAPHAIPAVAGGAAALQVTASGPGVFFATNPDERSAYVQPGDVISVGQLVAVLRVGALLLPVRSALAGRVVAVLAADAEVVGYGQPVLQLEDLAP